MPQQICRIAAANILQVRHAVCLAHAFDLIVKKSIDAALGLIASDQK